MQSIYILITVVLWIVVGGLAIAKIDHSIRAARAAARQPARMRTGRQE